MSAAAHGGRAVFLDRDGTLVRPRHYPSQPQDLVLFDGIAPSLRTLQAAGFRLVVITNQSGLAHDYFSEDDLARMHDYLRRMLEEHSVRLDAIYYCPHHPDGVVPALAISCDCRKPRPGMLLRAAHDLRLDLAASWFLGDILDDVEAGNSAGCRTVLVDLGTEPAPASGVRRPTYAARDTAHALSIVAAIEGLGPAVDLAYQPRTWQATGRLPLSRAQDSAAGNASLGRIQ